MHTEYPLKWPIGWKRTTRHQRESGRRFLQAGAPVTLSEARRKLADELRLLGAPNAVLTCNEMNFRTDDPGIAIYFTIGNVQKVMACDRYDNQAANCRSLGLCISGMRQVDRHGGPAMMNRAFDGFTALPSPDAPFRHWRDVFGFADNVQVNSEMIERRFRVLVRKAHPDAGGSHKAMSELNVAREQALREIS